MELSEIFGSLGPLAGQSTLVGAVFYGLGLLSKVALDWTTGKRRQYMDQLQVALEQQKLDREAQEAKAKEDREVSEKRSIKQDEKINILQGQIVNMSKELHELRIQHTRVLDYVDILEQQVKAAGLALITPTWKKEQFQNGH